MENSKVNSNPLLKSKAFLFATEFLVGIALMGVEIGASRLIAPYLSSSQVIWTIIIGMIMIAMAGGNYLGGKLSDKHKDVTYLYVCLLISGTYIILVPYLGRFVIAGVAGILALFVNSGLIIWSAIIICLLLFIPPLLLLGMVTPTMIKYAMGNKATSGKIVGIMEALNTLGSILGTFLPTFVTIPFIGTSASFALFGGLIAFMGLLFLVVGWISMGKSRKNKLCEEVKEEPTEETKEEPIAEKAEEVSSSGKKKKKSRPLKKQIIASAICVPLLLAGIVLDCSSSNFVFWGDGEVIYEGESMYNYLQVKDLKRDNSYEFSTSVLFSTQSKVKKDGSLTNFYYDYCMAAPYLVHPQDKEEVKVLILGNGTGSFASLLKYGGENDVQHFPFKTDVTGVEIDQKIIDIGKRWFCPDSLGVKTVCDDGRNYISHDTSKYDVIMVDAYSSISSPFSMTTVEFFNLVKSRLNDNGVMVMNVNMIAETKGSIDQALCDTVSSSFSQVKKFNVPADTGMEVFASDNPHMWDDLKEELPNVEEEALRAKLWKVYNESTDHVDNGIRLYDDNADVELRSMNAIDGVINDQLGFYREYLKEHGLWALLEYVMG